jgi:rhamnosyltransferase
MPDDVVDASSVSQQQSAQVHKLVCQVRPIPPTPETICAVVVTYHPDLDFFERFRRIAPQVGHTVIVDNGSSNQLTERLQKLAGEYGIHLILNGHNEGLANALNAGARWAIEQGFPWVLTLDQDTVVAPSMVDSFTEIFRWYPFPGRLAIIGSNYRDKTTGKVLWDEAVAGQAPAIEIAAVLTSGSLVSVDTFQALGGFRGDFFIDCVDFEYCLRARSKGFQVLMTSKPVMEHAIGHLTEHRLLWKTVRTSNHSPARQYFLARNSLILVREYFHKEPQWIHKYLWAWIRSIVRVVLLEEQRVSKVKNILRGCVDGALGRTKWKPK